MEDVLEVYHPRFEDNEVLVCLDETSKQLVEETRPPRPARPGAPLAYDYEYRRNGVSKPVPAVRAAGGMAPGGGDGAAHQDRLGPGGAEVGGRGLPGKGPLVLVMDNLNTHHPSSLYEAFEPGEARRIAERLEIHYTPKHGSWLNMAESELAVLAGQCLDRRIPGRDVLSQETGAWQGQRNRDGVRADWRFTTADARIKLKSLYPSIQQ